MAAAAAEAAPELDVDAPDDARPPFFFRVNLPNILTARSFPSLVNFMYGKVRKWSEYFRVSDTV